MERMEQNSELDYQHLNIFLPRFFLFLFVFFVRYRPPIQIRLNRLIVVLILAFVYSWDSERPSGSNTISMMGKTEV